MILVEIIRAGTEGSHPPLGGTARSQAAAAARRAARRLRDQGLPLHDVGQALGVSFQRAKQLIDEADKLAS